jgi:hypothetical protein
MNKYVTNHPQKSQLLMGGLLWFTVPSPNGLWHSVSNIIWLVVSTPLKNMKVSWDDDIPNMMGKIKAIF